ncbi:hypothetical protein BGW41_006088 [Actinomortierella wolfii]|nr:hypothetical protein BGW41_006088 [Actinomortierella wolfii]
MKLYSLLPLPVYLQDYQLESPRPMDSYLARITDLTITEKEKDQWIEITRHYPDLAPARILQRCRGLTWLSVDMYPDLLEDSDLFAWAVQESHERDSGKLKTPMVAIKDLHLNIRALDACNAIAVAKDALVGFSKSLCSLEVCLKPQEGLRDDEGALHTSLVDDKSLRLPKLSRLGFSTTMSELFDISLLQISPNLEHLSVSMKSEIPSQTWPLVQLSKLTYLSLEGVATNSFDPAALGNMPHLRSLYLSQMPEDPSPDVLARMERWTWDWHLPLLNTLSVDSAIEGWFSLRILRTCPRVKNLSLSAARYWMLEVQSVLDDPERDVYRNITHFSLERPLDIRPDDLSYLLHHVLPKLEIFETSGFDSCTGLQVVEATRDHDSIGFVQAPANLITKRQRKKIGLYWDNDDDPCHEVEPGEYAIQFGDENKYYHWAPKTPQ